MRHLRPVVILLSLAVVSPGVSAPPVPGQKSDNRTQAMVDDLCLLLRGTRLGTDQKVEVKDLPAFEAKTVEKYQPEGNEAIYASKAKEFPLRAAVLRARQQLVDNVKQYPLLVSVQGDSPAAFKKAVFKEQSQLGKAVFFIQETLEDLDRVKAARVVEKSRRWQANYDFVRACLRARLIYLTEHNYALAKVRADDLPAAGPGVTGYSLTPQAKLSVPEAAVKKQARELAKDWERVIQEYPGTPWAELARRERAMPRGLVWQATKE